MRIIGGAWRKSVISFPVTEGLRPTPDRVRETVFNWLGQDLGGLNCLDLFAGSGAFGIEAASRGASRVVLVEKSREAAAALRANTERLGGVGRVELRQADALQFAALCAERFDVIFVDPPYGQGWLARLAPLLSRLAAPRARLYIEAEAPVIALDEWRATRSGTAGQVHYQLLEREEASC
ncbi:MAG TPA: 16S rRNA (guanine(966)-N(2))-methyltransferase RsmD [Rhodocyclaceae bacterium]